MLYLILGAAGLLMWWAAWRRHGFVRAAIIFLVSGALVGYADMVAHSALQLYEYRPGLLPSLTADGPLGFLLAEMLFVPALATGVLLNPRYRTLQAALLLGVWLTRLERVGYDRGNRAVVLVTSATYITMFWGTLGAVGLFCGGVRRAIPGPYSGCHSAPFPAPSRRHSYSGRPPVGAHSCRLSDSCRAEGQRGEGVSN